MIVPLTLADFLERAEHVYGDREAIVDEPNPPGGGLGRDHLRGSSRRCRAAWRRRSTTSGVARRTSGSRSSRPTPRASW